VILNALKQTRHVVACLILGLVCISQAMAQTPHAAPHEVVKSVTESVMAVIKNGEKALKENPEQYFAQVRSTLEPSVSFSFIARNVMASYWDQATEEQRNRFTEAFTRGMVETLGKGLANYSDLKIITLTPEGNLAELKRVEVVQEVAAADGTSRISYTMAVNKTGEWKLINVVLNGVNLGKSFRDQFAQSMKQNDNNIDKVIANWAQKV
jgi:phospholipid transport system substrate-binding protein